MRMRRKKHLEERLAGCGDMIIYMDREDRNYEVKDTENIICCEKLFGNSNPVELDIILSIVDIFLLLNLDNFHTIGGVQVSVLPVVCACDIFGICNIIAFWICVVHICRS